VTAICRRNILLLALVATSLVGCGGSPGAASSKELSHLRVITALYFQAKSKLGKNPSNEEEFKQAINSANVDWSTLGVSGADELLISDRDGKPLVIVYGPPPQGRPFSVVAYEQEGLNGVRLVGTSDGQIQEADAAQFAKLVPQPTSPQ
jgi:hypothetical protein